MRSRIAAPAIFFLLLAGVLLGSGAAGARPAPEHATPAVGSSTPFLVPAGHDGGKHCRTRRDPVAPDAADL